MKLPPLPYDEMSEVMITYAKLAVREALERILIMIDESEGDIDLLRFKLNRLIGEYE